MTNEWIGHLIAALQTILIAIVGYVAKILHDIRRDVERMNSRIDDVEKSADELRIRAEEAQRHRDLQLTELERRVGRLEK